MTKLVSVSTINSIINGINWMNKNQKILNKDVVDEINIIVKFNLSDTISYPIIHTTQNPYYKLTEPQLNVFTKIKKLSEKLKKRPVVLKNTSTDTADLGVFISSSKCTVLPSAPPAELIGSGETPDSNYTKEGE